jgi:hypothetical protein
VGLNAARPLLAGNPRARLKELLEARLPTYEALAWVTVDTDGREPQEIADDIAATVSAWIAAAEGEGAGVADPQEWAGAGGRPPRAQPCEPAGGTEHP